MNQPIEHLREQNRNRLIGLALEHLHLEGIATALIPIPGGDRVIAIGTPAQVAMLLELPQARESATDRAINRACGELPLGYDVLIELENGAGGVVWYDADGERHVIDGEGYISQDVCEAVDRAIEHAFAQPPVVASADQIDSEGGHHD